MLHPLLLFLHVLSVAVWMAAALWVAGDVRRTLALGRPHVDALAARIRPALGLDAGAGLAVLATGVLVLVEERAFHPRMGLQVGIAATLVRLGLLAGLRRSWRGILARLGRGDAVAPDDAAARRMSMLAGVAHTLWLVALAGMVFPF